MMRIFERAVLITALSAAAVMLIDGRVNAIPVDRSVLNALKKGIVTHVCSDQGQWLTCFDLAPSRCNDIAEQFVTPCVDRLSSTFPKPTSEKEMIAWGQELSQCFNTVFGSRHGKSQKNTPECREPPAHLR